MTLKYHENIAIANTNKQRFLNIINIFDKMNSIFNSQFNNLYFISINIILYRFIKSYYYVCSTRLNIRLISGLFDKKTSIVVSPQDYSKLDIELDCMPLVSKTKVIPP